MRSHFLKKNEPFCTRNRLKNRLQENVPIMRSRTDSSLSIRSISCSLFQLLPEDLKRVKCGRESEPIPHPRRLNDLIQYLCAYLPPLIFRAASECSHGPSIYGLLLSFDLCVKIGLSHVGYCSFKHGVSYHKQTSLSSFEKSQTFYCFFIIVFWVLAHQNTFQSA